MAETINMPKLGFDMAEGLLVRWVRQVGEPINKGEVLAEIETDKATVEVESPASGVVLQHIVDQGTLVPINAPIAVIGAPGEKVGAKPAAELRSQTGGAPKTSPTGEATTQAAPSAEPPFAGQDRSSMVKASPLARKMAKERKVDLSHLRGTGPGGRIVRRDIEAALGGGPAASASKTGPLSRPAAPAVVSRDDQVVKITKLRQAIGRRLVESKTSAPHFYVTHEFKVESLIDIRRQLNEFLPQEEKLSLNDFILKAAALTLRQFPNLNANIDGERVIQFGRVNLGVAVTVPGGLMTVVVKDADQKTLRQISAEVKTMAGRAREGRVKPEDVEGSTFSTSNLGMYEVEDFIAIINPPEAAILAISSAREVPVVAKADGRPSQLDIGWRMKATISVDHRVSDGAEAAQYMQALAGFVENPARMLV